MNDVLALSLSELAQHLRKGKLSPRTVADACLQRIEATEGRLNAYVRLLPDSARAAAATAEAEIAAGHWRGPLHGVPVAIKDLYDMEGIPTTASSRVRTHWVAHADSEVVRKLKAAGAVIVGKTHTHEFAYGAITPTTRNPWDPRRTPGGSSGGSAASVAACGVYLATGTDTAGSIRIPSALSGAVGLKPTHGRVSRHGLTPLSWSLDHAGPIARTVADTAVGLQAMAGHDARDTASLDEPVPDLSVPDSIDLSRLRVGVPTNYFFEHVDPEIEEAVRTACRVLQSLGARLVDVTIPMPEQITPALFTIIMAEASAYHQRMLRATPERYTDEVRTLLEAGSLIPATDYLQAQRVRRMLQCAVRELYRQTDVIVAPTVPATAALAGTESVTWADDMVESLDSTYIRFTGLADLLGLPSLGMPCGFSSEGLPIGMQLTGKPLDERELVRIGAAYEHATDWHQRHPALDAGTESSGAAASSGD